MLGSIILRFDRVESTNDIARELAARGAEEGIAITAREQTAGRGRLGRVWSSPVGEGLYLSLILRPRLAVEASGLIALAGAIAVTETLKIDFGIDADIKWPNDVLVSGRKICGILVETAVENDEVTYAVMGIGVNLTQRQFPTAIRDFATSVLIEGRLVTAEEFLGPLLPRLDRWYTKALTGPQQVIERWEALSSFARGCSVIIESSNEVIEGRTQGLASGGALRVETSAGEVREINSGEVKLRKLVVGST